MSLLLDALKKAAEDKKKAAGTNTGSIADTNNNTMSVAEKTQATPEYPVELTLEDVDNSAKSADVNESSDETSEKQTLEVEPVTVAVNKTNTNVHETRHTVSDDALSLLIYKTNSAEKKRKWVFAIGTITASLLVLILGGVYYYINLQKDINDLELKHQASMMMMESKTNRQRTPEKEEIISNLTANSNITIEEKVSKIDTNKNEINSYANQARRVRANNQLAKNKLNSLIIEKTKQADIVGEKLEKAWVAYEAANYTSAKQIYQEVMQLENNNRDALLGLGAIAVIEKNTAAAVSIYNSLLKLDPNDPLAVAALSNLHSEETSPKLSEKYLVSKLEKSPDVAQLNFELGNVYAKQSKWSAAQQSYFKAWQQDSENADYIFNLAVSLDQLGQQKQALNFYKDSLLKAQNKQVSFSRNTIEKRINELSGL